MLEALDELGSLGHLPWPGEGSGLCWELQEDELCPFSAAGLVLKQELNLIHCQRGRSFKRNAALTAEDVGAISLPAHHQHSPHPLKKPNSPSSASLLPARAHGPQLQSGFTPSSTLILSQHWLRGALGLPWGHSCLSLGCQLCVYPSLRGVARPFPKAKRVSGVSRH